MPKWSELNSTEWIKEECTTPDGCYGRFAATRDAARIPRQPALGPDAGQRQRGFLGLVERDGRTVDGAHALAVVQDVFVRVARIALIAFDQIRIDLALLVAPVGACRPAGIHQAPWRQRPQRQADGVGGGFAIVEVTVALDAVAALADLIAPVAVHIGR
ncbi:hypothetical protein G6F57_018688 [Rhizopus arrhizus]|nr:hypothetical protein G6F57_018688 [Rhizopus arrhizus]